MVVDSGSIIFRSLRVNRTVLRFSRPNLPPVRQTFESELDCQLSRADRRGEASGNCPFHSSKSRRSFKVNLESGLWYCHGCGFGGDMVEFCRRRYGFSFLEAARYLGAIDETGRPSTPPVMAPVRYLTFDYDIDGLHHRASMEDESLNHAGKIRRFYREAADRLGELGRGDRDAYAGEQETCWTRMACAVGELREFKIAV